MRIISGRAGGIRLQAPEGMLVRPTEDRVKESMFGTLGDLQGKTVLDLFAGTGALGLEALSRGAVCVHGFECDAKHCAVITRNIAAVEKSLGNTGGYVLHRGDARMAGRQLQHLAGTVDVILADPPYATETGAYGWRELMLDTSLVSLLAPAGLLVLEHDSTRMLPWYPESSWQCLRTRVFGIRAVSFAKLAEQTVAESQA